MRLHEFYGRLAEIAKHEADILQSHSIEEADAPPQAQAPAAQGRAQAVALRRQPGRARSGAGRLAQRARVGALGDGAAVAAVGAIAVKAVLVQLGPAARLVGALALVRRRAPGRTRRSEAARRRTTGRPTAPASGWASERALEAARRVAARADVGREQRSPCTPRTRPRRRRRRTSRRRRPRSAGRPARRP